MLTFEMRIPAQRVHLGPIGETLRELELDGPVLVLGSERSVRAIDWNGLEERAHVVYFTRSRPHNPQSSVEEARRFARAQAPRAIVAVGSASAIDLGKAISEAVPGAAMVAIPSTLGGAEMSRGYGVLEPEGRKATATMRGAYGDVCYDPELLATLPAQTLGASGLNAWAHTIEAHYARRAHWLGKAAAVSAGRRLPSLLLAAAKRRDTELHRSLFEVAHLAGFALNACSMGLHHATCHALGGLTQIPHGVLNAMVLPHAVRLNARLAPQSVAAVAEAFTMDDLPAEAERVRDAFDLPRTLAELRVPADVLERALEHIAKSPLLLNNPAPVERSDIAGMLRAVYGGP